VIDLVWDRKKVNGSVLLFVGSSSFFFISFFSFANGSAPLTLDRVEVHCKWYSREILTLVGCSILDFVSREEQVEE
jgi:hypothetical protein